MSARRVRPVAVLGMLIASTWRETLAADLPRQCDWVAAIGLRGVDSAAKHRRQYHRLSLCFAPCLSKLALQRATPEICVRDQRMQVISTLAA